MITRCDTSEFLSVVLMEKAQSLGTIRVTYGELFTLSNKVIRVNRNIRIQMNTVSIREFCDFLHDKCEVQVTYDDKGVIINENIAKKLSVIKRYNPSESIVATFKRGIK